MYPEITKCARRRIMPKTGWESVELPEEEETLPASP